MICFPNAKINLGLSITDRRADGYHNLESVFYPIRLHDALELVESDELSFTSSGLAIPGNADSNLCVKAYHLLAADFTLPPVHIHLHKHGICRLRICHFQLVDHHHHLLGILGSNHPGVSGWEANSLTRSSTCIIQWGSWRLLLVL
jgi:hypothetical protein